MVFLGLSCYKFWLFSNCQATTATTTTIITTSKFCCWQQTFVSQCIKFGDCNHRKSHKLEAAAEAAAGGEDFPGSCSVHN